MQFKLVAACPFALAAASILAQQPTSSGLISNSGNRNPSEKIYDSGPEVTAPLLLPSQPLQVSTEKCKRKFQRRESVQLSLYVTSDGKSGSITFLHAIGNNLDQTALDLAHADRFTPAMRSGEQVAVWQSIDISFQSCREDATDKNPYPESGLTSQPIQKLAPLTDPSHPIQVVRSQGGSTPVQRIGGGVSPPVPLSTPEAHYSVEARKKKIQGECFVSLIVDAEGMPQNPRVVRPVGYGLDEYALEAIKRYRFKPALKGGEPVAVTMSIQVNFRLY